VPAELEPGLLLAAVSAREDARDVIVSRHAGGLAGLPPGAHVGTSSLRRVCQLRARRADLRLSPLRGNVDTRLRKLDAGEYDAIVLAAAGLVRLGHGGRISERLPLEVSLPAIGQGALGLETRADDAAVIDLARRALHDEATAACVAAERAFLARLDGGCQTPIAAHARLSPIDRPEGPAAGGPRDRGPGGDLLAIEGLVGDVDGATILRDRLSGPAADAAELGRRLADALLSRGAAAILERCRANGPVGGA
jgi:hydroxymethylbilane synthase